MKKINNFKVIVEKSKANINGFGLVDSILSLTLLAGIITYGVYFSSLRLSLSGSLLDFDTAFSIISSTSFLAVDSISC